MSIHTKILAKTNTKTNNFFPLPNICKGWKAKAYKKAEAFIWLVRHPLRSLNTVNKGHNMINMSIDKDNLDVLN